MVNVTMAGLFEHVAPTLQHSNADHSRALKIGPAIGAGVWCHVCGAIIMPAADGAHSHDGGGRWAHVCPPPQLGVDGALDGWRALG